MKRAGGWIVASLAYCAFAVLLASMMSMDDTPFEPGQILEVTVASAVLASPWIVAAHLLWRAWWKRTGARIFATDGPARLLAFAVALLPDDRREWGDAMSAELVGIEQRSERWRFALGAGRAAIVPRESARAAMLVMTALSLVAAGGGWFAGNALPGFRVFALTFVVLLACLAISLAPRWRVGRMRNSGPAVAAAAIAGAGGCVGAIVYYLVQYSSARQELPAITSAVFASLLVVPLWLAISPPPAWNAPPTARRLAVVMALMLGLSTIAQSRVALALPNRSGGLMGTLWLIPMLVLAAGSALAALKRRSFRAGVQTCAWAAVLGLPPAILAWLMEAPRWQREVGGSILDADAIPIGTNLGDALWWTLIFVALFAVPAGVIGAYLGSISAPRAARPTSV